MPSARQKQDHTNFRGCSAIQGPFLGTTQDLVVSAQIERRVDEHGRVFFLFCFFFRIELNVLQQQPFGAFKRSSEH